MGLYRRLIKGIFQMLLLLIKCLLIWCLTMYQTWMSISHTFYSRLKKHLYQMETGLTLILCRKVFSRIYYDILSEVTMDMKNHRCVWQCLCSGKIWGWWNWVEIRPETRGTFVVHTFKAVEAGTCKYLHVIRSRLLRLVHAGRLEAACTG